MNYIKHLSHYQQWDTSNCDYLYKQKLYLTSSLVANKPNLISQHVYNQGLEYKLEYHNLIENFIYYITVG